MVQSKKSLMESITKLAEQLQSMEQKMDKFSGDLGAVQTKVDLTMTSISLVQEEQVQVAKFIKSGASTSTSATNAGVMGPPPAGHSSSSSGGAPPPPPPLSSSNLLRQQVNPTHSGTIHSDLGHAGSERSNSRK
jgi:hypothetical protein